MARQQAGKDDPAEGEPPAPRFPLPYGYVLETYRALRLYGVLPEAGGWMDQSQAWRDSMLRCEALLAYHTRQVIDDAPDGTGDEAAVPVPFANLENL
jgi:hypothetical protein